jgi:hypothetical protein
MIIVPSRGSSFSSSWGLVSTASTRRPCVRLSPTRTAPPNFQKPIASTTRLPSVPGRMCRHLIYGHVDEDNCG